MVWHNVNTCQVEIDYTNSKTIQKQLKCLRQPEQNKTSFHINAHQTKR